MNAELLLQEDSVHSLLADGNWKCTDYYEFDSGSHYFGCVNLITLSKQITANERAALLYLFQRIYCGAVSKDNDMTLSANALLHWLIGAGYIGSPEGISAGAAGSSEGVRLSPLPAANNVEKIIQAQLQSKEIRVFKNGHEINPFSPFNAQQVITVTAFKNLEDTYLYFIETDTDWMYFNAGA